MKRRHLIATGILAACIVAVLGLTAFLRQSSVKARYELVEVGMTLEQVETIFGRPANDVPGIPILSSTDRWQWIRRWHDEDGSRADIYFDVADGIVTDTAWQDSTETTLEKLRRSVRWPWW